MDYEKRAISFLENLTTNRDLCAAAELLHDSMTLQHNDLPTMTKSAFIAFWPSVLDQSPHITGVVQEIIRQDSRVWVYSCVTGRLQEGPLDDIHMLQFNQDGLIISSHGVQRPRANA
ncbi:hypothetical protein FE257_000447 [Aspergillus nanangensis]|uniref:SnoaL-like domain-containing protein n=1 Tax=Aspergillus nanangensis TaxID=2582783 RepID=A0AAD4GYQ0_ASPNN|nr:hypothetical protein FE257_000447 [Aspergillus nanangensis]